MEEPERPDKAWIEHATGESAKRKCVVCGCPVEEVSSPKAICEVCSRRRISVAPPY